MTNILTNQEKEIVVKILRSTAKAHIAIEDIRTDIGGDYITQLADKLEGVQIYNIPSVFSNTPIQSNTQEFYGVSLEDQCNNISDWDSKYKLKLPAGYNLFGVKKRPKPENPLTAWVLVPYLNTLKQTIDFLWEVIKSNSEDSWKWGALDKAKYKMHSGKFPKNTLKWVKVDLGAYHKPDGGRTIEEVYKQSKADGETLAGVEVLAAAAHFPKWFEAQDGEKVPWTDCANVEVKLDGESRSRALYLNWTPSGREARLSADWVGCRDRGYAAPVLRECLDA